MAFLIVSFLYIVLPFCFAAGHNKINKQNNNYLTLSFAYFVFFNIFLKGVPIGIAATFFGHKMALDNGWVFNPMFTQYGVTVLALGLLGLPATFISGGFRIATALGFGLFLTFVGISHIAQLLQGIVLTSHQPIILIASDFITALILFYFCLNPKTRGNL